MKKLFLIISAIVFLMGSSYASAQFYLGGGANYINPLGDFSDRSEPSIGADILIENRRLCNWWYGFRIQYNNYDRNEALPLNDDHYSSSVILSPQLRYNFLYRDKYNGNLFPYIQAAPQINTFSSTDEDQSDFGIGISAGAGISYGFCLSGVCFILDANGTYGMPNLFIGDESRESIDYFSASLTLSVGL